MGKRFLSSPKCLDWLWDPPSPPSPIKQTWGSFAGGKVGHDVQNEWSYTFTFLHAFMVCKRTVLALPLPSSDSNESVCKNIHIVTTTLQQDSYLTNYI